jgi:DNA-binding NarL/FixJ family response regulator
VRVLLCDDHQVFAEALALRLGDEPDFQVVGTAVSAAEALELLERTSPDVVALDLLLGRDDGLALAEELGRRWPDLGIVIVTGVEDGARIVDAVQSGVRGWVAKVAPVDVLVSALRGVAAGETHIPADLLTGVLVSLSGRGGLTARESEGLRQLTQRELDVLACLVDGMARTEIGQLLHVSPNTVRTHVQSILHKLQVHSALAAVAIARHAGVPGAELSAARR